jgi:hypothetical protein
MEERTATGPENEPTSLRDLVEQFLTVRNRTVFARHGVEGIERPADYWAELQLGAKIAQEVTAGRWCAVADLLRLGSVGSWAEVGEALGMSETDAREGFSGWIHGQWNLYRRTGSGGLTDAEAEELRQLAEAVAF